ncbi:MAG: hypothetical protein HC817_07520 [Saprospiraceae bacterium]|nr:hypothetical protein [Saprospiraceae bacterium]
MKQKKFGLSLLLSCTLCSMLNAQILMGASARFNNSFAEWDIYDDSLDQGGTLNMTWQQPDDWSQWSYRLGEKTGTIKTKWSGDFSQWEIRGENKVITATMTWRGDPRQWRITDNTVSLDLISAAGNIFNEWIVTDGKRGTFKMTLEDGFDLRDWAIEDELDETICFPMKMTLVFLAVFCSVPKN